MRGRTRGFVNGLLIIAAGIVLLWPMMTLADMAAQTTSHRQTISPGGPDHPAVTMMREDAAWDQVRRFLTMGGRFLLALGLAVLIGLEREARDKPAGVRTISLVAAGACLFGLMAQELTGEANPQSRIIQGLITGLGFLGAGTIIKERFHIEGLTTAAALWASAGVGLACGLGFYMLAALGTMVILAVLIVLRRLDARIRQDSESDVEPADTE